MVRSRWTVSAIAAAAILAGALPASAGGYGREQRPALVTFGGPTATVVESPDGGFDDHDGRGVPVRRLLVRAAPAPLGARVPVDFATALVDREGIEALLLRPDAERSEDALLVELTDTTLTPEGRFTAHATVVDEADDPLARPRRERGRPAVGRRAGAALGEGGRSRGRDGRRRARTAGDPGRRHRLRGRLEQHLRLHPVARQARVHADQGAGRASRSSRPGRPTTSPTTGSRCAASPSTAASSAGSSLRRPPTPSRSATARLNLDVEQESVTNSNFKVTRCDGAGLVCKGSNGFKQLTINIFRT